MKFLLAVLFGLLASGAALRAETPELSEKARHLLGDWRYLDPGQPGHLTLSLRPNGRFFGTYVAAKDTVVRFIGRWKFEEDKIHYVYDWISHPMTSLGDGFDTVIVLTDKTLIVVEGASGARKTYQKVTF